MNSVWRSLLWKEWREHRWKLAALAATVLVVPTLLSIRSPGDIYSAITFTLILGLPLAATFIGMGTAAGEESRGTIRFLQALPTPMARPAAAKLLWAALTMVLPVLAALAWSALWSLLLVRDGSAEGWEMANHIFWSPWGAESWYAAVLIGSAMGGASILVWVAAAGVNHSDEVRAGAVGMLVALAYWAALALASAIMAAPVDKGPLLLWTAAAPGGPAIVSNSTQVLFSGPQWFAYFWPYAATALASHIVLVAWYLKRFGRVAPTRVQAVDAPRVRSGRTGYLAPPRKNPLTAIIWKQFRESAPLAAMGAGMIVLAAIGAAAVSQGDSIASNMTGFTTAVWIVTGVCVAVVAGVGTFMDDLRPGIHTFWRSRPIRVNQWFAAKFAIALAATLLILAIPPFSVVAFFWTTLRDLPMNSDPMASLAWGLAAQVGLFVIAATAMTLIRQPIYAAILSLGVAATYAVAVSETLDAWAPGWDQHIWIGVVALLAVPVAVSTIVAWLAVRNDWGWKS